MGRLHCWPLFLICFGTCLSYFCSLIDWIGSPVGIKQGDLNQSSSKEGLNGLWKKLSYWVILIVAFSVPVALVNLGAEIGIFTTVSWFTLKNLMVNEMRTILENLVESDYHMPNMWLSYVIIPYIHIKFEQNDLSFQKSFTICQIFPTLKNRWVHVRDETKFKRMAAPVPA